jgi:hypothetical protein
MHYTGPAYHVTLWLKTCEFDFEASNEFVSLRPGFIYKQRLGRARIKLTALLCHTAFSWPQGLRYTSTVAFSTLLHPDSAYTGLMSKPMAVYTEVYRRMAG